MGGSFGQEQFGIVPAGFKSQIFDICVCLVEFVHTVFQSSGNRQSRTFLLGREPLSLVKVNHRYNQIQEREKQTVTLDERGY